MDKLWNERHDFCLDVHFKLDNMSPYMRVHDRYTYDELEQIFEETDVLIAPSIWYETFGYTVLEALSYGVPVIISKNVGAKDILQNQAGIIISDISENGLYECLKELNVDMLRQMNRAILEKQKIITLKEMSDEIINKCYT